MPKGYASPRLRSPANGRDSFASIQGDLFQRLQEPAGLDNKNVGDMDVHHEFLGAVHAALKEARALGYSRERVVDRMNQALPELPKPITLRQLYCWTASSKEYHEMPARFVPAFCWACGSDDPLRVLAGAIGMNLVDAREAIAKRLGETQIEIARKRREAAPLAKSLGG
jgi:hypothetical protein